MTSHEYITTIYPIEVALNKAYQDNSNSPFVEMNISVLQCKGILQNTVWYDGMVCGMVWWYGTNTTIPWYGLVVWYIFTYHGMIDSMDNGMVWNNNLQRFLENFYFQWLPLMKSK